jgi:gamma-glutamylcyclotransferase (GGCT)/AIG2-like uncharacterized protein YtfP
MHGLLDLHGRFESEGTVQGQLFDLGNYPGLVLSRDPLDRVLGEIYRLEPSLAEETLRQLDEYEGIRLAEPETNEYRREIVTVRLTDGSAVDAWAYVLQRAPENFLRILSGDYLEGRG